MAIKTTETMEDVCGHLLNRVKETLDSPGKPRNPSSYTRVEVAAPAIDILSWLKLQSHSRKLYWSDREGSFEVAGIGAASLLSSESAVDPSALFNDMRLRLDERFPHHRYYGGFSFNPDSPIDSEWKLFGAHTFFMPLVELGRNGEEQFLACHIAPEAFQNPESFIHNLQQQLAGMCAGDGQPEMHGPNTAIDRLDTPEQTDWERNIHNLLERFDNSDLKKVVLARKSLFSFSDAVHAPLLLQRLKNHTSFSYHYCFQIDEHSAFIGASPERLYKHSDGLLDSEALAGTRPRGPGQEQDTILGRALLESEKDLREQRMVMEHISDVFESYCSDIEKDPTPQLLRLRHCQHLLSRITGSTADGHSDGDLLKELHPTPAVGGVPTQEANACISELEPFDRGWYAAPVGWVANEASEFAVAIRSALIHKNTVAAYSGAGIVPGSDPRSEWEEIETKIADFQHILTQS